MNDALFYRVLREVKDVRGSARLLLLVLLFFSDRRGASWLKPATLAEYAQLSRSQCRRLIAALQEAGLVVVEPPPRPGFPDTLRVVIDDRELLMLAPPTRMGAQETRMDARPPAHRQAQTTHDHRVNNVVTEEEQGHQFIGASKPWGIPLRKCAHDGCDQMSPTRNCQAHSFRTGGAGRA